MPTYRERNGRYQAQVRLKEQGRIVYQESATFDTRKQAELWALTLERKLEREGYESRNLDRATFGSLVDKHRTMLAELGRDVRGYEGGLQALLESSLADMPISQIKQSDITKWAREYAQGRSGATVLHQLMLMRSIYRSARTMHGVNADLTIVSDATDQLLKLGVAARSIERDRRVSDEELDAICKRHEMKVSGIPFRIICNLALALPRRREELMTMKWEDYKNGELRLWDTKDPTGVRNETIPVPPKAQEIIDKIKRTAPEILPYKPVTITNIFRESAMLAGLGDIHFHDLRHEGISRLFEAGLNIPEVSLISGHRSWATLKRYTHLKPSNVLEKLSAGTKRSQKNTAKSE